MHEKSAFNSKSVKVTGSNFGGDLLKLVKLKRAVLPFHTLNLVFGGSSYLLVRIYWCFLRECFYEFFWKWILYL